MIKNKDKIIKFLGATFLFDGLAPEQITDLVGDAELDLTEYQTADIISSPDDRTRRIGFVYSGECAIERRSESEGVAIPLNKLSKGDGFGVLSVFSNEEGLPTYIVALNDVRILFIDEVMLYKVIEKSSVCALNVIRFMGDRISFLNKKISTFSPNNTRQKVANHLFYLSEKLGSTFKLNCQKTSATLNIGRASLYRSIDALVDEGVIEYTSGIIKILDIDKLERISK